MSTLRRKIGAPLPDSWQGLKDWLTAVKSSGVAQYGLALQFNPEGRRPRHGEARVHPASGSSAESSSMTTAPRPSIRTRASRSLEYWKSLIDAGLVFPDPVATTENTMYDMMASSTLPMQLNGPWVASTVHQSNPSVKVAYLPPFKEEVANGTFLARQRARSFQQQQAASGSRGVLEVPLERTGHLQAHRIGSSAFHQREGPERPRCCE